MPKYYCDYCKSVLTHDSTSVRKSHLVGKNHIKYVSDYYRREAAKLGFWQGEEAHIVTIDEVYGPKCPGAEDVVASFSPEYIESNGRPLNVGENGLNLPPTAPGMPSPPVMLYKYSGGEKIDTAASSSAIEERQRPQKQQWSVKKPQQKPFKRDFQRDSQSGQREHPRDYQRDNQRDNNHRDYLQRDNQRDYHGGYQRGRGYRGRGGYQRGRY